MKEKPIVSLCLTSYNRYEKLKNCVESFLKTNLYPMEKIEIVIVDNGSDDKKTVEYINALSVDCYDVKKYFNEKNDYPYCLRRAKNQARYIATGEYFIDCPDDHLFVLKSDWISRYIEYLEIEKENISCICHYAYPLYRFEKANNKMIASDFDKSFYVSQLKGYADYHLMKRSTFEHIGKYREDLSFTPNAESEYMERSYAMGYKRAMPIVPVSIINDGKKTYHLKSPVKIQELNLSNVDSIQRPISNEEMINYLIKSKKLS